MWADAHRKNIGIEMRKEDDYSGLYKDDFAEYLRGRYQIVWDNVMRKSNMVIYNRKYGHSIGITYAQLYLENAFISVEYEKDDKTIWRVSMNAKGPDKEFSELFREIRSKYKVARKTDGSGTIYIDNRDGSPVTNKTIVELIDLVIDFVGDKCTLRKK